MTDTYEVSRLTSDIPEARIAPAAGLALLGQASHSGHRNPPSLVRRPDGQMVQLTPLLYAVLASIDGVRDRRQVAAQVSERTGRTVTPDDIGFLVAERLRPLGLIDDGRAVVALPKANPLLAIRPRKIITDRDVTRRIARPFSGAFAPPLVVAGSLGFVAVLVWLFFFKGLAAPLRDAFHQPGLFLLLFGLMMLSAGFHELGHAAALIYGGGVPDSMGVGLYLVWPAFYTDVTDSYRLDRRARLRVDLGGIYFNALFGLAAFGLWAVTGWEALLVVVPLQLFQIVRQLVPLVRLDGYHILADITGVPDLFAHMKTIFTGLLPTRWGRPENKVLKPWVRAVVTVWTLAVVPLLLFMMLTAVIMFPRLAATAWESATIQWGELTAAWDQGAYAGATVRALAIAALLLPVAAITYLVVRIARRISSGVWRATTDRPLFRGTAVVVAIALVASLGAIWWPDGQYEPIGRNASGLPVDVRFREVLSDDAARAEADLATRAPLTIDDATDATLVDAGLSTRGGTTGDSDPLLAGDNTEDDGYGDYRFTAPEAPGEGDNQALAMNYADGSTVVDLAFSALVLTEDLVDNKNEAWALASCTACTTVAAALQVLLIVGSPETAIPENVAVAVNVDCATCATYALAIQLVATITGPLSPEAWASLASVGAEFEALEASADELTVEDIAAELAELRDEVVAILVEDGVLAEATISTTEALTEDPTTSTSPTPTTDPSTSPSPSTGTTTEDPTPEPTPEEAQPTPSPTDEPSEPSPSPTSGDST